MNLNAVPHPSSGTDWFRPQSRTTVIETRRLKADIRYTLPNVLAIDCITATALHQTCRVVGADTGLIGWGCGGLHLTNRGQWKRTQRKKDIVLGRADQSNVGRTGPKWSITCRLQHTHCRFTGNVAICKPAFKLN